MTPGLPLRTARLVLRPFEPGDLDDLHRYLAIPAVHRYLYTSAFTRSRSRSNLRRKIRDRAIDRQGDTLSLAMELAESGKVVGDVMLHLSSLEHRQGEIGYVLNPQYERQGFMTEAARALLEAGFGPVGLHRIIAKADARNRASIRVMERLGTLREAHRVENEFVKGEWTDEVEYAIREEQFRGRG